VEKFPVDPQNAMHAVLMVIPARAAMTWSPTMKLQWCKAYHSMLKEGSSTRMKILSPSNRLQDINPSSS